MRCSITNDSLFLNGKRYTRETLDDLPTALSPLSLSSCSNDESLAFFGKANPLSNFYPANFVVNGVSYSSAEQFYQAQKAIFANDTANHNKIMQQSDPAVHKKIGSSVKIDHDLWVTKAPEVMHCGLLAKFSQNKDLAVFLANTGSKKLLEASPKDTIWGTGVSLHHKNALTTDAHPGKNLLGAILMSVRHQLSFSNEYLTPPNFTTSPISMPDHHISNTEDS